MNGFVVANGEAMRIDAMRFGGVFGWLFLSFVLSLSLSVLISGCESGLMIGVKRGIGSHVFLWDWGWETIAGSFFNTVMARWGL